MSFLGSAAEIKIAVSVGDGTEVQWCAAAQHRFFLSDPHRERGRVFLLVLARSCPPAKRCCHSSCIRTMLLSDDGSRQFVKRPSTATAPPSTCSVQLFAARTFGRKVFFPHSRYEVRGIFSVFQFRPFCGENAKTQNYRKTSTRTPHPYAYPYSHNSSHTRTSHITHVPCVRPYLCVRRIMRTTASFSC